MNQKAIPWRYRLEIRQAVPILIGLTGILVLLLTLGYLHARKQILVTARAQLEQLEDSVARQDDYSHRWLERGMQPLAHLASKLVHASPQELRNLDDDIISILSDARGQQIVDVYYLDEKNNLVQRQYNSKKLLYAGTPSTTDWTAQTIFSLTEPLWDAPQMDTERNLTIRYSVPLKSEAQERTIGICSIALAMPWFTQRVLAFSSFENCTAFFLTHNGTWTLPARSDTELSSLKQYMLSENAGEKNVTWEGNAYTAVFMPLTGGSLRLGVLIPRENLFRNLDRLTRLLGGIGITVLLLAAYSLHRTTTSLLRPFKALGELAFRLARGELDSVPEAAPPQYPSRFPTEAERLQQATENLRQALHQRVRDLSLVGKTRERLFGELAFARTLQEALRPKKLPPTPSIETAAFVHTAGNVCGDMYDYFYQSPQSLCCIMGNVAERGVPAALLTGRVIPLLHELLLSQIAPGKALENVNRVLAPTFSQDQSMVSVLVGILSVDTGFFHWACAGHLPPFRCLKKRTEQLPWSGNVPLGIRVHEKYKEQEIQLRPGEMLFFTGQRLLSTPNTQGQAYGEDALQQFLANRSEPLPEVLRALYTQLRQHADGPPQDDLTYFAVRWRGNNASVHEEIETAP